ncbi:hypothetical protein [Prevotella koreensis]|uniref:hypothetical protein n=1 Tax=Prevotella koreensis TaxID=2490854 RepID=UPI0028E9A55C|nr:hypothetical protein [Prevotella koreensis]
MFVKLIKESTINWKPWKYLISADFLGFFVLFLGKDLFALSPKCSVILGIVIILSIWLIRFLYLCFIYLIKLWHNIYVDSIWGYAIVELKNAYSEIHFLRKQEDISDEKFIGVMILFCDTLKKIFDKKTNANCCVSIKVPISIGEKLESLELRNLCRDSSHGDRDTELYRKTKHRIIGNTAFSTIVNNILKENQKQLAYVNNNIPNSSNYQNTSIECYNNRELPYSSELVYPIVPIRGNDKNQKDLKGFICIDCDKPNKFDEHRYDIPMVQGIADGIYDIFAKRNNG